MTVVSLNSLINDLDITMFESEAEVLSRPHMKPCSIGTRSCIVCKTVSLGRIHHHQAFHHILVSPDQGWNDSLLYYQI